MSSPQPAGLDNVAKNVVLSYLTGGTTGFSGVFSKTKKCEELADKVGKQINELDL